MKHVVDARGLACPLPVVNTKNEIKNMAEGESVEVLVDNEIAVQNLTKFANVRNHTVHAEKTAENEYHVVITLGEAKADELEDEEVCQVMPKDNTVVVLSSNQMGSGEDALGKR